MPASDLSVLIPPRHLKAGYKRLALISRREQIKRLDLTDEETLVVTTDWLAWRILADQGAHATHVETEMADWPAERGDINTFYLRHGTWMYDNDRDMTSFFGISLGKQFNGHVVLMRHLIERLWHALDHLCHRYHPAEIILYDIRLEYGYLDDQAKRMFIEALASRHGSTAIDRLDSSPADKGQFPSQDHPTTSKSDSMWRREIRGIYALIVEALTRIRAGARPRHSRVFVLLNWIAVRNLVRFFDVDSIIPVLLANHWPKNPAFLVECLKRKIVLARLPQVKLTKEDESELRAMDSRLRAWAGRKAPPLDAVLRHYVCHSILNHGALRDRAIEVKRYLALFNRFRFSSVLLGESCSILCRTIADIAKQHGTRVEELLNGMFMSRQRVDMRCGDAYQDHSISRLLAWGEQQEAWHKAIHGRMDIARVGYPALDHMRSAAISPAAPANFRRILLLPLSVDGHDLRALYSNTFSYMVECLRGLKRMGVNDIRVKLHPGFPEIGYYEEVLRYYQFNVPVYKIGSLEPHVRWADAVIGPINSGSLVETMALGKPYYALRGQPSSLDAGLFGGIPVHDTVESLLHALASDNLPDVRRILETVCSFTSIPNASRSTWAAIARARS